MAIQFLHNIDLNDNQLLNAKLHTTGSAPTAAEGQVYFDSASHHIKIHDGTRFLKAPRDIIINDGNSDVTLVSFQDFKLIEGSNTTFTVAGSATDAIKTLTIASDDTTYTLPVTNVVSPVAGSNGGSANITLTDSSGGTDPVTISGTAKEVNVTGNANAGSIQIGFPSDVTIDNDLTVENDLTVNGSATITGNLTVSGTTTTVNSTVVTIKDPVIELGGGDGGAALSADDNLDKGVTFNWHNGTDAKLGFFGYDDSTGYFTFIPDATNSSEVFSGTAGVADLGGVRVPDSGLVLNNTAVSSTAAELNMLDAGTAGSSVALADGDSIIIGDASANPANTTKKVLLSDVKSYIGGKVTKKISGDASTTSFNVTHSFGTPIVSVTLLDYGNNGSGATYEQVFADIVRNDDNSVTVSFATAPSASQDYLALITSFPAIS